MHPDLPELTYTDVATGPMVISLMDRGGFDLVILDGESIAGQAYDDAVSRILGEERPMRFTTVEKKGFFSKLFGG